MSCTTVKALWPGDRVEDLEELRNSWGSAPLIWGAIGDRYGQNVWAFDTEGQKRFWDLWEDPRLPEHHRLVLLMTYDRFYVRKQDYARAAAAIRACLSDFDFTGKINHWPRIAEIFESDPACEAIGFHWTSVADDPWQGRYDEATDESDQIDWATATDVFLESASLQEAQ